MRIGMSLTGFFPGGEATCPDQLGKSGRQASSTTRLKVDVCTGAQLRR
jgi:hypothetical protein